MARDHIKSCDPLVAPAEFAGKLAELALTATGLNRSVLVAVLAAAELTGEPPAKLVRQLRRDRSRHVLYNETFERYALRG